MYPTKREQRLKAKEMCLTRTSLDISRLEAELAQKRKDLEDGELEDGELDDDEPVITHETSGPPDRHSTEDMQGKKLFNCRKTTLLLSPKIVY